jgi:hypothetical protein
MYSIMTISFWDARTKNPKNYSSKKKDLVENDCDNKEKNGISFPTDPEGKKK